MLAKVKLDVVWYRNNWRWRHSCGRLLAKLPDEVTCWGETHPAGVPITSLSWRCVCRQVVHLEFIEEPNWHESRPTP